MITYVLDTNIISLLLRHDSTVRKHLSWIQNTDYLVLGCPVVRYEVMRGLLVKDARLQKKYFEQWLEAFDWPDIVQADWDLSATLWAQRQLQGRPIHDADLLIAAFCRNHNAILVTDNEKDFVGLELTIENWAR